MSSILPPSSSRPRTPHSGTPVHLPIVAMIAHAMKGDRERCLAAGMDAYVTKPLQAQQLFEVIEGLVSAPTAAETERRGRVHAPVSRSGHAPPNAPAKTVSDGDGTLARVDGNRELLQEIIGLFFDETPGLLAAIQETGHSP